MAVSPQRFRFVLPLIVAIALVLAGTWFLNALVNNAWLVPPENPRFFDLQRAVVEGRADSNILMTNANKQLIAMFLAAIAVVGMGIGLLPVYLINYRLDTSRGQPHTKLTTLLRQAMWVGVFIAVALYLQMNRTFGLPIALLALLVIGLLELMFHAGERSSGVGVADGDAETYPQETDDVA